MNNLSGDPSQLALKDKVKFFEKLPSIPPSKPKPLSFKPFIKTGFNISKRAQEVSSSDNSTHSSASLVVCSSTPQSTIASGSAISSLLPINEGTVLKQTNSGKNKFQTPQKLAVPSVAQTSKEALKDPKLNKIFHDLDAFVEKQLNEISRIKESNDAKYSFEAVWEVLTKLAEEFDREKEQRKDSNKHQEPQPSLKHVLLNDHVSNKECQSESEEYSESECMELSNFIKLDKIRKLKLEASKEEKMLIKINHTLENVVVIDKNLTSIVNIERHYLVAANRLQSALNELRRLKAPDDIHIKYTNHRKGTILIQDIMLEVKSSYFQRKIKSENEFLVVMLKHNEEIYATQAIQVIDDVRVIRFGNKFIINEACPDFEMRLEIYGTTFWRKETPIRDTMLKRYGFTSFTLGDSDEKRKRLNMTSVIKNDQNLLRKKILISIEQNITANIHYEGILLAKFGNQWHQTHGKLDGHLLKLKFINHNSSAADNNCLHLDLHNFDSDFVIPVVFQVSNKPYTFLLKFNHYVEANEFYLLVAADSAEGYSNWMSSINKALVLIK